MKTYLTNSTLLINLSIKDNREIIGRLPGGPMINLETGTVDSSAAVFAGSLERNIFMLLRLKARQRNNETANLIIKMKSKRNLKIKSEKSDHMQLMMIFMQSSRELCKESQSHQRVTLLKSLSEKLINKKLLYSHDTKYWHGLHTVLLR